MPLYNENGINVTSPITVLGVAFGHKTVTTAGSPESGPDVALTNGVWITALPTNTKNGWVSNVITAPTADGWPLVAGGSPMLFMVDNLNKLYFDMSTGGDGQGFAWAKA